VLTRRLRQAELLDRDRFPGMDAHPERVQALPAIIRALRMEGLQPV
jgi:hypothetical protein